MALDGYPANNQLELILIHRPLRGLRRRQWVRDQFTSHVVCILVSPFAKPGYGANTQYSHYSLLATVGTIFRTGNLGRGDSTAGPMSDLFTINLS